MEQNPYNTMKEVRKNINKKEITAPIQIKRLKKL